MCENIRFPLQCRRSKIPFFYKICGHYCEENTVTQIFSIWADVPISNGAAVVHNLRDSRYWISTETQLHPSSSSEDASSWEIHMRRNLSSRSLSPFWLLKSELQFLVQLKCQWKKREYFLRAAVFQDPRSVRLNRILLLSVSKFVQKGKEEI